jgi:hypothetical protein
MSNKVKKTIVVSVRCTPIATEKKSVIYLGSFWDGRRVTKYETCYIGTQCNK